MKRLLLQPSRHYPSHPSFLLGTRTYMTMILGPMNGRVWSLRITRQDHKMCVTNGHPLTWNERTPKSGYICSIVLYLLSKGCRLVIILLNTYSHCYHCHLTWHWPNFFLPLLLVLLTWPHLLHNLPQLLLQTPSPPTRCRRLHDRGLPGPPNETRTLWNKENRSQKRNKPQKEKTFIKLKGQLPQIIVFFVSFKSKKVMLYHSR